MPTFSATVAIILSAAIFSTVAASGALPSVLVYLAIASCVSAVAIPAITGTDTASRADNATACGRDSIVTASEPSMLLPAVTAIVPAPDMMPLA